MEQFYGKQLVCKDKDTVWGQDVLSERIIGLYFSAGWCPPCKQFTPVLSDVHSELTNTSRNSPFEIVFISLDQTEDDMFKYFQCHGDWYAVPFESELSKSLIDKYSITSVPKLIILRPDGQVITDKGRKEVQDRGVACFRNWASMADLPERLPTKQGDENRDSSED